MNEHTIGLLEKLSHDLATTKTDIVEQSITRFFQKNTTEKNDMLRFAGLLDSTQADTMLADIAENRDSKRIKELEVQSWV